MQLFLRKIYSFSVADEILHLIFKAQLLNQRATGYGNNKAKNDIYNGNLPPENTHQQNK